MSDIPKRLIPVPGGKRKYDSSKMQGRATVRQKALLDKYGLKYKKDLTKAQASNMIQGEIDRRKEAAIKRRIQYMLDDTNNGAAGFSYSHDTESPEDYGCEATMGIANGSSSFDKDDAPDWFNGWED